MAGSSYSASLTSMSSRLGLAVMSRRTASFAPCVRWASTSTSHWPENASVSVPWYVTGPASPALSRVTSRRSSSMGGMSLAGFDAFAFILSRSSRTVRSAPEAVMIMPFSPVANGVISMSNLTFSENSVAANPAYACCASALRISPAGSVPLVSTATTTKSAIPSAASTLSVLLSLPYTRGFLDAAMSDSALFWMVYWTSPPMPTMTDAIATFSMISLPNTDSVIMPTSLSRVHSRVGPVTMTIPTDTMNMAENLGIAARLSRSLAPGNPESAGRSPNTMYIIPPIQIPATMLWM